MDVISKNLMPYLENLFVRKKKGLKIKIFWSIAKRKISILKKKVNKQTIEDFLHRQLIQFVPWAENFKNLDEKT